VVAADRTGRIFIFNPVAAQLTSYSADEALGGLHRRQIYPEGEDERILDRLRGPEDGGPGKLERYRTTLRTREGNEVPVRLNAAMVYQDGQEVASIGFFRDLRSEIRMQRDLEQTQLQLLQAEKMSTLGELAAGVAHQLNNPLGSITLYAGLILEEYPLTEDLRQDLQRIALDADRCRDTVRELLAFARQTRRLMHPQNLNQAIERTLFLLQSHPLFQNIDIQINHVLVNILVNAAQAMQGRGRLLVRTLALPHKDRVFVEIADSGPGIAPDTLPHIFEPFFTTKPEGRAPASG
jgi:two-component system NtrC family sensor kinase